VTRRFPSYSLEKDAVSTIESLIVIAKTLTLLDDHFCYYNKLIDLMKNLTDVTNLSVSTVCVHFREVSTLQSNLFSETLRCVLLLFCITMLHFRSSKVQPLYFFFCSFTITDMFGCSIDFKLDSEYYVFASYEEYDDGEDPSYYVMDFAVNPSNNNTPANLVQRLKEMKEDPPQCKALPAK